MARKKARWAIRKVGAKLAAKLVVKCAPPEERE